MANRIIFTKPFRVSFPHLAAPHAQEGSNEQPKFSIGALFPKSGLLPNHLGDGVPASNDTILAALDEVCQEQFGIPYQAGGLTFTQGHTMASFPAADGWTEESIIAQGYAVKGQGAPELLGVNFPPPCIDGDTDWKTEKNAQGIDVKQVGTPKDQTKGMWRMSFKNINSVGCAGADATPIDPNTIYAGCWARAQIEVTAYQGGKGNVITIKLLNVQMMFDDERFGGGHIQQSAEQAFAGMAVTNTNIATGTGQVMTPVAQHAPVAAAPVAAAPVAAAPVAPAPVAAAPAPVAAAPAPVTAAPVAAAPVTAAPVAAAPVAAAPVTAAPVAAAPVAAAPVTAAPVAAAPVAAAGQDYLNPVGE